MKSFFEQYSSLRLGEENWYEFVRANKTIRQSVIHTMFGKLSLSDILLYGGRTLLGWSLDGRNSQTAVCFVVVCSRELLVNLIFIDRQFDILWYSSRITCWKFTKSKRLLSSLAFKNTHHRSFVVQKNALRKTCLEDEFNRKITQEISTECRYGQMSTSGSPWIFN